MRDVDDYIMKRVVIVTEKQAFMTEFWQEHRQQLYQFILRRVSDPDVAEDIVQDVLTVGYAKLESLHDTQKLRAWLYQITRNAIIDHYRRHRPNDELPDDLADLGADESVPLSELTCCIQPFIDQLPDTYRAAVHLSEIDGLTQQEVAQEQGISLSGAKSRVQRGRKLLKALLVQCCDVEVSSRGDVVEVGPRRDCEGCA
jgi:RNA polymerase sigma-70 factor (ECF subfamily)